MAATLLVLRHVVQSVPVASMRAFSAALDVVPMALAENSAAAAAASASSLALQLQCFVCTQGCWRASGARKEGGSDLVVVREVAPAASRKVLWGMFCACFLLLYMLWSYYSVQVWPFEGLLSGPSFLFLKHCLSKSTIKIRFQHIFFEKKSCAQNFRE